jgi:hypothetical protein
MEVISFDWNGLTTTLLPSYFPFQIIAQFFNINICHPIIGECGSISLLASNAWEALGSSQLVLDSQNMLYFNRISNEPLGILP